MTAAVTIRVLYCKANEQQSYAFIKKIFTRGHYGFEINLADKETNLFFSPGRQQHHSSDAVYRDICADCSASYICESLEILKPE